jgi:hypothetical protein
MVSAGGPVGEARPAVGGDMQPHELLRQHQRRRRLQACHQRYKTICMTATKLMRTITGLYA